jgi:ABC-type lipoprotein release transport system permease subunit
MKFLISLAWKNLSRYRRRTIITAVAIAVGIALFIWIDAWLLGAELETVRNLLQFETGPARIMDKKYWAEKDYKIIKYHLDNPAEIQAALSEAGYESTQRISFLGEISKLVESEGSFTINVAAIDVQTDGKIFKLRDGIVEKNGRFLEQGTPEIIIGKDLAEDLGVGLGEEVITVVGLLETPNPLINKGSGFIDLEYAKLRLQIGEGATDVVIQFAETSDTKRELEKIRSALKDLPGYENWEVLDYKGLAQEFIQLAQMKSGGSQIIIFLIIIIAVIGISNTMLMAVFERVKEIGMMRAMGMKDRSIIVTFIFEAIGVGLIGSVVGLVIGFLLTWWMVEVGMDMRSMIEGMGNIGYRTAGIFKAAWNWGTMVNAFIMGIIIAGSVAFFPARRATRMQITDCLRDK